MSLHVSRIVQFDVGQLNFIFYVLQEFFFEGLVLKDEIFSSLLKDGFMNTVKIVVVEVT